MALNGTDTLWDATKPEIKSKETLGKVLDSLISEHFVEKRLLNRKNVEYHVLPEAFVKKSFSTNLATRLAPLGSFEMIRECMEFVANNETAFSNKEEAIAAAIEFWAAYYSRVCALNALRSLLENDEDKVLEAKRYYKIYEDRIFDLILNFKKNRSDDILRTLQKSVFPFFSYPTANSVSNGFTKFFKGYNQKALEKLGVEQLNDEMCRKEKDKELIVCKKYKTELPKWLCSIGVCPNFNESTSYKKYGIPENRRYKHCTFEKVLTTREKIERNQQKQLAEIGKTPFL